MQQDFWIAGVLSPLVTAGVTGSSLFIRGRLQERDQRHRARDDMHFMIEQANYIVALIDARERLATTEQVDPDWKRTALQQLDLLTTHQAASPAALPASATETAEWSLWREATLLRPVRGAWAKLTRILYWVSLLGAGSLVPYIPGTFAREAQEGFSLLLGWAIMLLVPTLVLFFGTRSLDRRARDNHQPQVADGGRQSSAPAQPLSAEAQTHRIQSGFYPTTDPTIEGYWDGERWTGQHRTVSRAPTGSVSQDR